MAATTILLYGRTGSGKTTQIGRLAEDVYVRTGKLTRLYTADLGGVDTIQPYINLGIIEPIVLGTSDPWMFLNKSVQGLVRDPSGKWKLDKAANDKIGFYAFESAHGIAQLLKMNMEKQAAAGINVGGDTNTSFSITENGESIKIGTTKGFQKFAIPQGTVLDAMYTSHKLDAEYVLWTAGTSKEDDEIAVTKVVGPDVLGKALTTTLPKDFNYTIRIDTKPAQGGKPEVHTIFLGTHLDQGAGNAAGLGNIRRPLDAKPLKELIVEPADIVQALKLIRGDAIKEATAEIAKRIGMDMTLLKAVK